MVLLFDSFFVFCLLFVYYIVEINGKCRFLSYNKDVLECLVWFVKGIVFCLFVRGVGVMEVFVLY